MKKIEYILLLLVVVLMSCQHEPLYTSIDDGSNTDGNGNTSGNTNTVDDCDPDTVYFVNDVLPIIQSNCAISGCHGGGSAQDGVELSDYSGIMQQVSAGNASNSDLFEVITDSDPDNVMPPPPNSTLTAAQITMIQTWINQGASNNECTDCVLTNVTYTQSVWPIIQNSCTGCHSGTAPQGNLSLTNYDQVAVIAENGYLSGVINHDTGFVPMPYNGQQLTDCNIDIIEDWIAQGFPNN